LIGFLKGKILKKDFDYLIVDVNGVGYKVMAPISTTCNINGSNVELLIETIVKEDSITLYGFLTEEEKELFNKLMTVSKIGPKLALTILSGLSVEKIIMAIQNNNIKLLSSIPGVGKKTAERICFDLKDKFKETQKISESSQNLLTDKEKDLSDALISLGYKSSEIKTPVEKVIKKYKDEPIENLIKYVLNELYNG